MKKIVALSTLQSLVSEHSNTIYQDALDCIKKEIGVPAQQTNNEPNTPLHCCEHHQLSKMYDGDYICIQCSKVMSFNT